MKIEFYKYQGTGNDFIIIDNRKYQLKHNNNKLFKNWCNRNFGIGADGIILLEEHNQYAFEMIYFNADGYLSSMCGNGGRCIVDFANKIKIVGKKGVFYAIDGEHFFEIKKDKVKLKLLVSDNIENYNNAYLVETGSPHYVKFVKEDLTTINFVKQAKAIRFNHTFMPDGINVKFAKLYKGKLIMRTYERGVENETLACGTGTVAVAMASKKHFKSFNNKKKINLIANGGDLSVIFENDGVWLLGKATFVFKGEITI